MLAMEEGRDDYSILCDVFTDNCKIHAKERRQHQMCIGDGFFVFVVETGEFENPADGAVSFIRDLMAACGKTRSTTKVWEARRVFKDDYARGRGGASDGAYFPLNTFRLRD